MKGFALSLGLKRRLRATRKWAIALVLVLRHFNEILSKRKLTFYLELLIENIILFPKIEIKQVNNQLSFHLDAVNLSLFDFNFECL